MKKDGKAFELSEDEEQEFEFIDHDENARIEAIQSPSPIIRDVYPRDSIRSQNRSSVGAEDSFFSPTRVQSMHGKFLKSDKNPKNNRHSIYRNEMLQTRKAMPSPAAQMEEYILNEIEHMKAHSNIFQKLSLIHKRKVKPTSRLFEQFYLVGPSLSGPPLYRNERVDISADEDIFFSRDFLHEMRSPTFHYQYP